MSHVFYSCIHHLDPLKRLSKQKFTEQDSPYTPCMFSGQAVTALLLWKTDKLIHFSFLPPSAVFQKKTSCFSGSKLFSFSSFSLFVIVYNY